MRVGRRHWVVVVAALVVAGCLSLPVDPPASFLERVQSDRSVFTAATPPQGAMTMDEAIRMARQPRGNEDDDFAPTTRVQAAYGRVTCPDVATCQGAFDDHGGGVVFSVWIVWSVETAGPDAGFWVAINADTPHRAFAGR